MEIYSDANKAQRTNINKLFVLQFKFYQIPETTINCLNVE